MQKITKQISQKGNTAVAAIAVALLAALAFFGLRTMKSDQMAKTTPPTPEPTAPETPSPLPPEVMMKKYTDGVFTAEGSYTLPLDKGDESISVTVTLKDGMVTDASFTGKPVEQGSIVNQKKFSDGYKALVVGKSIDEVALTVVNGSSLTPIGFMNALQKIKEEAGMKG